MGFSRQENWSGLPFSSPGDLPDQGSNLPLQHWQGDSLPLSYLGSSHLEYIRAEMSLKWMKICAQFGKYTMHFQTSKMTVATYARALRLAF